MTYRKLGDRRIHFLKNSRLLRTIGHSLSDVYSQAEPAFDSF
jgi:hypothetical protein